MNPKIVYEDNYCIVCYKPANMATETKNIRQQDLVSWLKNYRCQKGESSYLGVVHRLDQPVEGLLLFGKTKEATRFYSNELQNLQLKKKYLVITSGTTKAAEQWEDYLIHDKKRYVSVLSKEKTKESKVAKLSYKRIGVKEQLSLLQVEIATGRFHQIRCQMAGHNMAILGDEKYGGEQSTGNLCLCAYQLSFRSMKDNKRNSIEIIPEGKEFQLWRNE